MTKAQGRTPGPRTLFLVTVVASWMMIDANGSALPYGTDNPADYDDNLIAMFPNKEVCNLSRIEHLKKETEFAKSTTLSANNVAIHRQTAALLAGATCVPYRSSS